MQRYTEEFKAEAVRLALESGLSRSRLARDLGVNINSLSGWVKQALQEGGGPAAETLEQENRKLRRENARLQQERDILKKAVGIFSKELR